MKKVNKTNRAHVYDSHGAVHKHKGTSAVALASQQYWDDIATHYALPATIKDSRYYAYHRIGTILSQHLPQGHLRFIELGCAPGGWLSYFARKFQYNVSGIEYTKSGAIATRKNLTLLDVPADIRNEDLFNTTFADASLDVVFSFGLIEHFDDPYLCIAKHIALLKDKGKAVIVVPNFASPFYHFLQKVLGTSVEHIHVPYTPDQLQQACSKATHKGSVLTPNFVDYIGVCNLNMVNPSSLPLALQKIYWAAGIVFNWILVALLFGRETALFSPYLLYIGTKTKNR